MKAFYLIEQFVPETACKQNSLPPVTRSNDQKYPTSCHSDWKSRPLKQLWSSQPLNVKATELWAGWHELRGCQMVWDVRSSSSSRRLCSVRARSLSQAYLKSFYPLNSRLTGSWLSRPMSVFLIHVSCKGSHHWLISALFPASPASSPSWLGRESRGNNAVFANIPLVLKWECSLQKPRQEFWKRVQQSVQ